MSEIAVHFVCGCHTEGKTVDVGEFSVPADDVYLLHLPSNGFCPHCYSDVTFHVLEICNCGTRLDWTAEQIAERNEGNFLVVSRELIFICDECRMQGIVPEDQPSFS